jgi:hypothetical protein
VEIKTSSLEIKTKITMALKLKDLQVTNFYTKITSAFTAGLANDDGLIILGFNDGDKYTNPPTTASMFAPGCIVFQKNGTSASTNIVGNSGTTASVVWTAFTIS